jgi:hypothetical protein
MMVKGTAIPIVGLMLLSACVSNPKDIPQQNSTPGWSLPAEESYYIGDYQRHDAGENIPLWVNRYLEGGIAALESMTQFEGSYVFVAENSGTNLNALIQWSQNFSPAQDAATMVARRVQARFPGSNAGSPDGEYGRYFENLVRAVADTLYRNAQRGQDFWFQKQYSGGNGETTTEETYVFFILVTIDKAVLKAQLEPVLLEASEGIQLTRDQTTAINRLRESFFDGF